MTLYIVPVSEQLTLVLAKASKKILAKVHIRSMNRRHRLMREIDFFCTRCNVPLSAIKKICVVYGSGSFTNIRQATSVANTLHWLTNTRLAQMPEILAKESYDAMVVSKYLQPRYSGKPNITKSK